MNDDEPLTDAGDGEPFCMNPDCILHVRAGEPGVRGSGDWAVRPDGIRTSHARYGGVMLCDLCGRAWIQGRLVLPG